MRSSQTQAPTPDPAQGQDQPVMGLPGYQQLPPGPASPDPLGDHQAGDGSASASSGENPGPTPTRSASKAKASAYENIAKGVLRAAGGLLNKQLAAGDEDKSWLPDDDDDKMIPPPVGRLMARRIPLGDGENLTDLEDIGMAAVGLLAWGMKSVVSMWEARRAARRAKEPLKAAGTVLYDGGDGAGPEPQ
jgi:hypothetical protein